MLDDGEIFLDPPSAASGSSTTTTASRGLFSIREIGSGLLGGTKSWSEYAENDHPELRYEIKTREMNAGTDDDDNDTRPLFPATVPWLSGIACGIIWNPFPTYKTGYHDGYGLKLMSVPHFINCGAKLTLPRLWSTSRESRTLSLLRMITVTAGWRGKIRIWA